MDYDCTKPLGNQLENYLDTDLEKYVSNYLFMGLFTNINLTSYGLWFAS